MTAVEWRRWNFIAVIVKIDFVKSIQMKMDKCIENASYLDILVHFLVRMLSMNMEA